MPITEYCDYLASCGGMASCGHSLGVMVGTDILACPRGWIFMCLGYVSAEQVRDAIGVAKRGRSLWPPRQ